MKLTLAVLACLAIGCISAASVHKDTPVADKAFLEKQKFLFEIVYRIEDPLNFEEWLKVGGNLVVDKSKYTTFDKYMEHFYDSYKIGGLLPKGEFFSASHSKHIASALGLFNFFYYAKDWETFVHNAAWARLNMNEGVVVYALTLAVIHRPDFKGLILPPIYEIFPQYFFDSKFILQAEKFDWDVFNRQILLEKELKTVYDQEYPDAVFGKRFYLKNWKMWQWWKLMGLEEEWHLEEKTLFRNRFEAMKQNPKYKDLWTDVKAVWYPVDYTRDVGIFNEESKLSYFTEDIGWNAYWYYLSMDYAQVLDKKFHLKKDRRGEWWMYNVDQLLARYYLERLSNGFGEVDELSFYGIVKTGYDPQLIAYNGNGFTYRKNYFEFESYQNTAAANKIANIERRILDIIDSGKYVTRDGVVIDFTKPESVEYIGSLLHGHIDILDRHFLGYWYTFSTVYIGGGDSEDFTVQPNVLFNPETMLRDPMTYHLFKYTANVYNKFKYHIPSYTREELIIPDVKFENVEVSPLKTYFDFVDTDVSNLFNGKMVFHDGKFVWDKVLLARQLRLNHVPFNFKFTVSAKKEQVVVVRTFLAPDFDEYGQKIDIFDKRENFFELDEFISKLVVGENVIERFSKDFEYTINDFTTYTELYKYVIQAYEGKLEFPLNISQPHCGFPDRLILPHGWVKGFPVKLFFVISPYTADFEQFSSYDHTYSCGIGSGVRHIDNLPFGYPFDRKIYNFHDFVVPNMYIKSAKIYHTDKYEKYYPQKWEHYGTFDYNF